MSRNGLVKAKKEENTKHAGWAGPSSGESLRVCFACGALQKVVLPQLNQKHLPKTATPHGMGLMGF